MLLKLLHAEAFDIWTGLPITTVAAAKALESEGYLMVRDLEIQTVKTRKKGAVVRKWQCSDILETFVHESFVNSVD